VAAIKLPAESADVVDDFVAIGTRDDSGIDEYLCTICPFTAVKRAAVRRHLRSVHVESLGVHCEICGRRYKNKAEFRRHLTRNRCKPTIAMLEYPLDPADHMSIS
jgi:hypothetical protein